MKRRRRISFTSPDEDFIINAIDNPKFVAIAHSYGWCRSADGMTAKECDKITDAKFGTSLNGTNTNSIMPEITEESLDCLEHFTGLTKFTSSAFNGNSWVTSIKIPSNVTSLENQVFGNCSKLSVITIPSNVKRCDSQTFYNCTALTSVTLENGFNSLNPFTSYRNRIPESMFSN